MSRHSATRRTFLRSTAAVGIGSLLAGCQSDSGAAPTTDAPSPGTDGSSTAGDRSTTGDPSTTGGRTTTLRGHGRTRVVRVGPDGENWFAPAEVTVDPGATVRFVWRSDGHNVEVVDQPAGGRWGGHRPLEDAGFVYEHAFTVPGTYEYVCTPHEALGMQGVVRVEDVGRDRATSGPVATDRVVVGGDDLEFEPGSDRPAQVGVGEELTFAWASANHNLVVTDQPAAADWQGHREIEDAGFEASFTFDVPGRYEFACEPHRTLGARGTLLVEE